MIVPAIHNVDYLVTNEGIYLSLPTSKNCMFSPIRAKQSFPTQNQEQQLRSMTIKVIKPIETQTILLLLIIKNFTNLQVIQFYMRKLMTTSSN